MMMVFFMDITSFRLGFIIPGACFLTSGEKADGSIPQTGESAPLHEPPAARSRASQRISRCSPSLKDRKDAMILQDKLKR
jgi:hypothetical protein